MTILTFDIWSARTVATIMQPAMPAAELLAQWMSSPPQSTQAPAPFVPTFSPTPQHYPAAHPLPQSLQPQYATTAFTQSIAPTPQRQQQQQLLGHTVPQPMQAPFANSAFTQPPPSIHAFNTPHHNTAMPGLQPPPHYNAAIPNLQLSPPQYGHLPAYTTVNKHTTRTTTTSHTSFTAISNHYSSNSTTALQQAQPYTISYHTQEAQIHHLTPHTSPAIHTTWYHQDYKRTTTNTSSWVDHLQEAIGDIYDICQLSFQASIFTHMNHTLQQVPGSAIGNLISPVLANIPVSHVEHQWRTQPQIQSLLLQFSDRIYITRYVDNRIVLIDKSQQRRADIKHFLTDTFYEPPVLLEQEPDLSFLGCTIDPDRQTVSCIQPTNTWQFQPFASAASKQHKLSAAFSRICLAARHSYPRKQAKHDVESLIRRYVSLGYPEKPLRAKASQMLRHICWLVLWSSKRLDVTPDVITSNHQSYPSSFNSKKFGLIVNLVSTYMTQDQQRWGVGFFALSPKQPHWGKSFLTKNRSQRLAIRVSGNPGSKGASSGMDDMRYLTTSNFLSPWPYISFSLSLFSNTAHSWYLKLHTSLTL